MSQRSVYQGMTSDELEKLASAGDTIAAEVLKQREENQNNYAGMKEMYFGTSEKKQKIAKECPELFETPERHRMNIFPQAYIEITGIREIIAEMGRIHKELHTMNEALKRIQRRL